MEPEGIAGRRSKRITVSRGGSQSLPLFVLSVVDMEEAVGLVADDFVIGHLHLGIVFRVTDFRQFVVKILIFS